MNDLAPLRTLSAAPQPTIGALFQRLRRAFRAAGIATPELDARILTTETLGVTTVQLIANPKQEVAAHLAAAVCARAQRRVEGQSIGRILGRRAFWSLDLQLGPACLEPRPETETVVELALSVVRPAQRDWLIADLGVGSGAILLALLTELPNAYGVGLDISPDALATARVNAERHQLSGRASFVAGNFAAPLAERFDIVVSNPPYIATSRIVELDPVVRQNDPLVALDGGLDGLDAYRTVFSQARYVLKPGATMIVEIDPVAHDAVVREAAVNGLEAVATAHDLTGRQRAVALRLTDRWTRPDEAGRVTRNEP